MLGVEGKRAAGSTTSGSLLVKGRPHPLPSSRGRGLTTSLFAVCAADCVHLCCGVVLCCAVVVACSGSVSFHCSVYVYLSFKCGVFCLLTVAAV